MTKEVILHLSTNEYYELKQISERLYDTLCTLEKHTNETYLQDIHKEVKKALQIYGELYKYS